MWGFTPEGPLKIAHKERHQEFSSSVSYTKFSCVNLGDNTHWHRQKSQVMLQIYLKPQCSSRMFSRDICRHAFKSLHIGSIEEKQEWESIDICTPVFKFSFRLATKWAEFLPLSFILASCFLSCCMYSSVNITAFSKPVCSLYVSISTV